MGRGVEGPSAGRCNPLIGIKNVARTAGMSGERSEWRKAAQDAAEAVERSRAVGAQLGLFGDPAPADQGEAEGKRGPGRPKGSRNAGKLGLAEWMAAHGWRAPGHAVALAAGLAEDGDGLEIAFRRACWLRASAIEAVAGDDDVQAVARLAGDVMALTLAIWREQNAAAAQLLRYTLAPLAPLDAPKEGAVRPRIGIAPPSAAVAAGRSERLLGPAQWRAKMQQDQWFADGAASGSDEGGSDDGASG